MVWGNVSQRLICKERKSGAWLVALYTSFLKAAYAMTEEGTPVVLAGDWFISSLVGLNS